MLYCIDMHIKPSADLPATSNIGGLSGCNSIWRAIQSPSKWAYHLLDSQFSLIKSSTSHKLLDKITKFSLYQGKIITHIWYNHFSLYHELYTTQDYLTRSHGQREKRNIICTHLENLGSTDSSTIQRNK